MPQRNLRLWPAAVAVGLILLMRLVALAAPDVAVLELSTGIIAMLGSFLCAAAIVLWWLFFSRAPWSERLGGVGLILLTIVVIWPLVHPSITGGLMSRMLPIVALPVLATALVVWATLSRRVATGARWGTMVLAMAIGAVLLMVIRTDGITGDGAPQLRWRWTPTAEQRLLASAPAPVPSTPRVPTAPPPPASAPAPAGNAAATAPTKLPDTAVAPTATPTPSNTTSPPSTPPPPMRAGDDVTARVEWPGFRGRNRDSVVAGVQIDTDWASRPPVELWRKPIGPGWSSFAVDGDLVYTQEQRGNDELVSCYRLSTGDVVWRHSDPVRFYESNGGAGPRATPALHNGRVYAHGATGIVNALDAKTGAVLWSRNAASDSSVEVPGWGVTSSPLVVEDLVIVAVSGRLVAYDIANGALRWLGPAGGSAYSSPHLVEMDGVPQVLLPRGSIFL